MHGYDEDKAKVIARLRRIEGQVRAITQMVEDNTNQRENILPSERAKALKMQLEAIKHQGAKEATSGQLGAVDKVVDKREVFRYSIFSTCAT